MRFLSQLDVAVVGLAATVSAAAICPPAPPLSSESCPATTAYTTTYVITHEFFGSGSTWQELSTYSNSGSRTRSCPTTTFHASEYNPTTTCTFNDATCINLLCLGITTVYAGCPPSTTDTCCGPNGVVTKTIYKPCPTACPKGCGATQTVTIVPPCVPPPPTAVATESPSPAETTTTINVPENPGPSPAGTPEPYPVGTPEPAPLYTPIMRGGDEDDEDADDD